MAISYVGTRVDPFSVTTSGTAYQLRCPAGVVDGDILIGFMAWEGSAVAVLTPMTGWTTIATVGIDDGTDDWTLFITAKDGTIEDDSFDYTTALHGGSVDVASTRRSTVVHAYRGAVPIASQTWAAADANTNTGSTGGLTDTINNPDENNWVIGFMGVHDTVVNTFTATAGYTERHDFANGAADPIMSHCVYDSDGVESTGSKSFTMTPSTTEDNSITWIGIIAWDPPDPVGGGLVVARQAINRASIW